MAWSVLQSAGTATDSMPTATYPSNLSAGTKLIAVVTVGSGSTTAVQDASSNAFTKIAAIGLNNSTGTGEISLWARDVPAGDVGTKPVISIARGTNNGGNALVIQEVSGLLTGNTTAMIDGTAATNFGSGTSGTCGSYSLSTTGEYLLACIGDEETSAGAVTGPTGSTTYTMDAHAQNGTGFATAAVAYGNSTSGAQTATFTLPSESWGTILAAFKLAPAGSDSGPNPPTTGTDLGGGTGSWTSPGNITADDGSAATWAVV